MHRLRVLLSLPGGLGIGAIVVSIWNAVGDVDTTIALPSTLKSVWDFLEGPAGYVLLLVLGFVWLAYLIVQPSWVPEFLRRLLIGGQARRLQEIEGRVYRFRDHV